MATHPTGPLDPQNPQRNRHVIEKAGQDNRGCLALVEIDTQLCLHWLGESPTRSLSTKAIREWAAGRNWTPGYTRAIIDLVRLELQQCTKETAEQARARLVQRSEQLLEHVTEYKYGTGEGQHAGTVVMTDPKTGEPIKTINHGAALGYMKFEAEMLIPKEPEKNLHLHVVDREMAELTDEQLQALAAKPVKADPA